MLLHYLWPVEHWRRVMLFLGLMVYSIMVLDMKELFVCCVC